jgi:hypothetical protein
MPMVISGNLGPRGDGYRAETRMAPAEAQAYHAQQIETFAQTDPDMVSAFTINYVDEAVGILRAARDAAMPAVISFTVETDGRLPSGERLLDAIAHTDGETDGYAAYYMINCAHPTHFRHVLDEPGNSRERIRGLRANASRCSHAKLDECSTLDAGDPLELSGQYRELRALLPQLNVLGGCRARRLRCATATECRPISKPAVRAASRSTSASASAAEDPCRSAAVRRSRRCGARRQGCTACKLCRINWKIPSPSEQHYRARSRPMSLKRFILTVIATIAFALVWNGILHGLVLREAEMALVDLARPAAERSMPLALLLTAGIAVLFVLSHVRLAPPSGIKGGLAHGAFFGLLAGFLVDLNQYFLYPIPGSLAASWFVFGFCEFCIYGLIAARLYPSEPGRENRPARGP